MAGGAELQDGGGIARAWGENLKGGAMHHSPDEAVGDRRGADLAKMDFLHFYPVRVDDGEFFSIIRASRRALKGK